MTFVSRMKRCAALGVAALALGAFAGQASAQTVTNIAGVWSGVNAAANTTTGTGPYATYQVTAQVIAILNSSSTSDSFVLQDSSGTIQDYAENPTTTGYTPTVGDTITVTAPGSISSDAVELKASGTGYTETITNVTSGTAPTAPVISIPTFNAASNQSGNQYSTFPDYCATQQPDSSATVTLDNVSFTTGSVGAFAAGGTYDITDGVDSAVVYMYSSFSAVGKSGVAGNGLSQLNALSETSNVDLTGYVDNYYGASELYVTGATEVAVPSPTAIPTIFAGLLLFGATGIIRRRRIA